MTERDIRDQLTWIVDALNRNEDEHQVLLMMIKGHEGMLALIDKYNRETESETAESEQFGEERY